MGAPPGVDAPEFSSQGPHGVRAEDDYDGRVELEDLLAESIPRLHHLLIAVQPVHDMMQLVLRSPCLHVGSVSLEVVSQDTVLEQGGEVAGGLEHASLLHHLEEGVAVGAAQDTACPDVVRAWGVENDSDLCVPWSEGDDASTRCAHSLSIPRMLVMLASSTGDRSTTSSVSP